ncbi:unnamed protein product [Amoebophrya sp. A120]|nr:unnamed protein product [Amoebophrya sp. A120]|eukprot:GSA120T00014695001.1
MKMKHTATSSRHKKVHTASSKKSSVSSTLVQKSSVPAKNSINVVKSISLSAAVAKKNYGAAAGGQQSDLTFPGFDDDDTSLLYQDSVENFGTSTHVTNHNELASHAASPMALWRHGPFLPTPMIL